MKKRVLNLERRTIKYKIVIYGLEECSLRKEEETQIPNTILVEFNNYSTRDNVFKNISKLKNPKFL